MSVAASFQQAHKERIARINAKAWTPSPIHPPSIVVEALPEPAPEPKQDAPALAASIRNIQEATAAHFKSTRTALLAHRRSNEMYHMRFIAVLLAAELTGRSHRNLGKYFNGRDHTTIRHAIKRAISLRETNAKFKRDYDAIRARIMSPSHCPCCGQEIAR